jgi:PAS domain S-box-containing protein
MAIQSPLEASQAASTSSESPRRARLQEPQAWLLEPLDALLSEDLRRASTEELARARVMAGATSFMLLFVTLALLLLPPPMPRVPLLLVLTGYLATLVLLRGARSTTPPAMLLCLTVAFGMVACIFPMHGLPYLGTHAATMLLPAVAVYLMGPRPGLLVTAILCVSLGVLRPLYQLHLGAAVPDDAFYWPLHLCATISLAGAWTLSALHSSARDEAQRSLERAMRTLHENERKLSSLIESTEDLVCSMDARGRMVTTNSALRHVFRAHFGREHVEGKEFLSLTRPEFREAWRQRLATVLGGQRLRFEEHYAMGGSLRVLDISLNPILQEDGTVTGLTLFARDTTARREAETRLSEMHRTLVDVSRHAGMAEIATGVLHNVGNTLNSVNISTSLLADQLNKSRVSSLGRVATLLREQGPDLGAFFSTDQGRKLPGYLQALSEELGKEREALLKEVHALSESVDHIKSIVTMQQKHARAAGTVDQVPVPQLIDEALRLHAVAFERLGIRIEREYANVPPILVDRHKLLQILVNLLSNARHALIDSAREDKRLLIRVRDLGERLAIDLVDNGVGIAPENLPRLFTQGFTTKKTGHGFGLHISALAATEMKGRLSCDSAGPGQGATFTLELPVRGEEAQS